MTRFRLLIVLIVIVGLPLASQTPRFEVASVKSNTSGEIRQSSQIGKGSLTLTNMRMRAMLVLAFGVMQPERIVGLPSWTERERFDVTAKAPPNMPDDQLRLMLRTLLAERFRLIVHTEMREQPVYALVIARADKMLGPNLKLSTECNASGSGLGAGNALSAGPRACTVITRSDGPGVAFMSGGARTIGALVDALQGHLQGLVTARWLIGRASPALTTSIYGSWLPG